MEVTPLSNRSPMDLRPCICGHPHAAHHAFWSIGEPETTFIVCDATPGSTCLCRQFVLDQKKMPLERLDDYQSRTAETAVYPSASAIEYLALGLGSEVGEVQGIVKRMLRGDFGPNLLQGTDAMRKELGDALWYLARLAATFDLTLSDVANDNLEKLADRKARGVLKGKGDER